MHRVNTKTVRTRRRFRLPPLGWAAIYAAAAFLAGWGIWWAGRG